MVRYSAVKGRYINTRIQYNTVSIVLCNFVKFVAPLSVSPSQVMFSFILSVHSSLGLPLFLFASMALDDFQYRTIACTGLVSRSRIPAFSINLHIPSRHMLSTASLKSI